MKCEHCNADLEKGWRYCPKCGSSPRRSIFNFRDIFTRMRKEMESLSEEIDQDFDKDIEALDISPFFKKILKPHSSGFTIKIVSGTGMEPNVEVKTFGDVDREKIQKQIEQQLGYRPREKKPIPVGGEVKPPRKPPKVTEEPPTEVKRLDSRVVVDMDIPGVKSEEDIEITELESSVEVKALAGNKAYFKILTKPEQFSLVEKKFEKGKLHLEFG